MALTAKPIDKVRADVPVDEVVEPAAKGVIRGKKRIITIAFNPAMIDRIDEAAARDNRSRASWIAAACARALGKADSQ